jgi:hypothetical protein
MISLYSRILEVCVTYKAGSGFDDQIYWTFIQIVTTFYKSLSSAGHTTSDHTTLIHYSNKLSVIVGFSLYSLGSDHVA